MMITIEIPAADFSMEQVVAKCRTWGCVCIKKKNGYFEISTSDAINFFWLGANWNNSYLNDLIKENGELKKRAEEIYKNIGLSDNGKIFSETKY